jgi:hypothetical protein
MEGMTNITQVDEVEVEATNATQINLSQNFLTYMKKNMKQF